MAKITWKLYVITVIIIMLLNYVTGVVATFLKIPFFLDTWGTSLGVMVAGVGAGIIGGTLYNIVMAFTVWPIEWWIFFLANVWVAISTWLLWKKKWIDLGNPLKLIASGVLIGITNAIVVIIIHYFAFGLLPTFKPSAPVYSFFLGLSNNELLAIIFETLVTEIPDKTVSIFMAAIAYDRFREWRGR